MTLIANLQRASIGLSRQSSELTIHLPRVGSSAAQLPAREKLPFHEVSGTDELIGV